MLMPRSKEGIKRPKASVQNLQEAIKLVLESGTSIRNAAKLCNVSRTTMQRHFESHVESGNKEFEYKNNSSIHQVFSEEEEICLRDYLLTASSMHYGLTKQDLKKLAYQFEKCLMTKSIQNLGMSVAKMESNGLSISANETRSCR
ncbi:hypothetical protein J6590_094982 [Homalodisca vitripennis]|nr:hypothetical protein J6590_094982 [Homalodisca vitripennis]